jgi:hypothetical protein
MGCMALGYESGIHQCIGKKLPEGRHIPHMQTCSKPEERLEELSVLLNASQKKCLAISQNALTKQGDYVSFIEPTTMTFMLQMYHTKQFHKSAVPPLPSMMRAIKDQKLRQKLMGKSCHGRVAKSMAGISKARSHEGMNSECRCRLCCCYWCSLLAAASSASADIKWSTNKSFRQFSVSLFTTPKDYRKYSSFRNLKDGACKAGPLGPLPEEQEEVFLACEPSGHGHLASIHAETDGSATAGDSTRCCTTVTARSATAALSGGSIQRLGQRYDLVHLLFE